MAASHVSGSTCSDRRRVRLPPRPPHAPFTLTGPGTGVRTLLVSFVAALLSCGPEAEARADRDEVVRAFCEKVMPCREDQGVSTESCLQSFDQLGVDDGGWYDEQGCLDEELAAVDCLSREPCEEIESSLAGDPGPACKDEWDSLKATGCRPF